MVIRRGRTTRASLSRLSVKVVVVVERYTEYGERERWLDVYRSRGHNGRMISVDVTVQKRNAFCVSFNGINLAFITILRERLCVLRIFFSPNNM